LAVSQEIKQELLNDMSNTVQEYCASCRRRKNQKKLFSKKRRDPGSLANEEYSVIRCLECDALSLLLVRIPKGKSKPVRITVSGDMGESYYLFLDYEHKELMPKKIQELYDQVESAFESDSTIVTGLALRTMVEAICIDRRIPGKNLQIKLDGLLTKGLIAAVERPILDKLRVIGNESAHRIKSLPMDKLELALSIVNHMLRSIYILPKINKQLRVTIARK
jgi:hypothetical protein